jgi:hypothetical protein
MSGRAARLAKLEQTAPREPIPDADVGHYCDDCLGPNAYRRRIDQARRVAFNSEQFTYSDVCRGCGRTGE